jgi:hypothetical protein
MICFPVYSQTKTAQTCLATNPPKLRGFFIGQTSAEITELMPGFDEALTKATQDQSWDEEGVISVNSTSIFYRQRGVRRVPDKNFEDVDFFWHLFDGKLYLLGVKYLAYEPPNLQSFIKQVAEKTNLPAVGWFMRDKYHASIRCNGFRVELWTGEIVGRSEYKDYPTVFLINTVAEAEIKRRRAANKQRKKNEELEQIRRERERKEVFRP